ncbi:MAG: GldG family protein [Candidatus Tenebribacter burtonii]|jgi:gliding-associated putative ABC transporter substrate-binding component GldG|nr:GldG family protein [Candidatus Tenebribacter burtonii]
MKKKITIDLIIFIAILIFVNLISISIFKRFDLSRGKIYSLSSSSRTTVKNLEDRLIIKAYFSKNMPGEYADSRRFVQDILSEYQAYSKSNLKFEFLDPADEQDLKKEAQQYGIMPVSMRVIQNDKLEIREVYMGLVFHYQDKTETLPMIKNTQGLEYDITSKIKKITANGLKKIAFFDTGNNKFETISQFLSESYEISKIDLTKPVENNVDALIISGIEDSLEISQLVNIDQYLMQDGNIILFQDKIATDIQKLSATTVNSNLFRLLSAYGITIKPNLVIDAQCGQVTVQQQRGMFRMQTPVNYPFFPIINNINKENIVVKNLDYIQLIFASEIDTTNIDGDIYFEPLLYTSANSGEITMPQLDISYQPFMNIDLKKMLTDKPKVVAGIYSGKFVSNFINHTKEENALGSTESGKILLVSDSDFIKEGAGAGVQGNRDFVLNAVDYMVSDGTLIEIRSRETQFTPLKEVKSGTRKFVRWVNILFPSLLLILLGILHYRKELKRRKHIGELYE